MESKMIRYPDTTTIGLDNSSEPIDIKKLADEVWKSEPSILHFNLFKPQKIWYYVRDDEYLGRDKHFIEAEIQRFDIVYMHSFSGDHFTFCFYSPNAKHSDYMYDIDEFYYSKQELIEYLLKKTVNELQNSQEYQMKLMKTLNWLQSHLTGK